MSTKIRAGSGLPTVSPYLDEGALYFDESADALHVKKRDGTLVQVGGDAASYGEDNIVLAINGSADPPVVTSSTAVGTLGLLLGAWSYQEEGQAKYFQADITGIGDGYDLSALGFQTFLSATWKPNLDPSFEGVNRKVAAEIVIGFNVQTMASTYALRVSIYDGTGTLKAESDAFVYLRVVVPQA